MQKNAKGKKELVQRLAVQKGRGRDDQDGGRVLTGTVGLDQHGAVSIPQVDAVSNCVPQLPLDMSSG
jgi:hypothetical protein